MILIEQQLGNILAEQMNKLLEQLKQEASVLNLAPPHHDLEAADRYLLEINTFYYRTFHERYFSVYRQSIQQDVARLLKLAHDEASLQQDIMANIQRYARLYNQVKSIHALLTLSREESGMKIVEVTRDSHQQTVALLYALKTLLDRLHLLAYFLQTLQEFMEDEQLLGLARRYPDHLTLLEQVVRLDLGQPSISQGLNRLLEHIHHNHNLLRSMAGSSLHPALARETLHSMVSSTEKVLNRQAPQSLRSFYEQYYKRQFLMYTGMMELGIDQHMQERVQEMARQFSAWMERLALILDRGVRFASRHGTELLHSAHDLAGLSRSEVDHLQKAVQDAYEQTESLVADLSASEEADTSYFLERTSSVVEHALTRLRSDTGASLHRLPPLALHLERVDLELSFLQSRVEFFKEKQYHTSQVLEQYLQVHRMLQSYLDLLSNIKADLERMLAPRNISRFWKEHQVRVERIPLEKGQPFPAEYSHLLDHAAVEVHERAGQSPQVLHEEGDLFVIRVDQLTEYEIPRIVVGRSSEA